jgi:hypothetical protein
MHTSVLFILTLVSACFVSSNVGQTPAPSPELDPLHAAYVCALLKQGHWNYFYILPSFRFGSVLSNFQSTRVKRFRDARRFSLLCACYSMILILKSLVGLIMSIGDPLAPNIERNCSYWAKYACATKYEFSSTTLVNPSVFFFLSRTLKFDFEFDIRNVGTEITTWRYLTINNAPTINDTAIWQSGRNFIPTSTVACSNSRFTSFNYTYISQLLISFHF